jgi:benzoyl-CoA reductase/2-hydroxyglutaryl-CoA dehydratase subunit BcrC/BadD/HgdB
MAIMEELAQVTRTRPEILRQTKKEGGKIVGYTGRFVPQELICACNAEPYLLCRGGEPEPPDAVLPYMLRFMSPFARAQIGYHLLGLDPVIPMLDLVITQCDDCHMVRLADLFEYFKFPTQRIGVPADWGKSISRDYYHKRLVDLKNGLENLTGTNISDKKLKEAIDSINRIREVLANISLLRKKQPPPISGYDFLRLNHYCFSCKPDYLVKKLEELHNELNNNTVPASNNPTRILLAGHVVAIGDYVVPKIIEDSGAVIVAEFMDEGIWHHQWKIETDGDLMNNLVETYYRQRTPPSIFQPSWEDRTNYLKQLISDFNVDGVIWYQLSFEEIYDIECSIVSKAMKEMKVPFLKLESSYEYAREAMGPLTTRIESFIESIKGKRG